MADSILTVTTPATVRALTTLATVKAELAVTGIDQDAVLNRHILAASSTIERWCGRVFSREGLREVFRPTRSEPFLILARHPVATITSIIQDGTTLAAEDWEADQESGLLWALSSDMRTDWHGRKITAAYTAGYLLPGQEGANLPADIERACILLVTAAQAGQGRDPNLRSESVADVSSASYLDPREGHEALPPQVAGLLRPHRAIRT